jgi:hypothetical protein
MEATAPADSLEALFNEGARNSSIGGVQPNTSRIARTEVPIDETLHENSESVQLLAASHGTTSGTTKVTGENSEKEVPKFSSKTRISSKNLSGIQQANSVCPNLKTRCVVLSLV